MGKSLYTSTRITHFPPWPSCHLGKWPKAAMGSSAHKVHTTVAPGVTQDILQNPQLEWAWEIATQHAY